MSIATFCASMLRVCRCGVCVLTYVCVCVRVSVCVSSRLCECVMFRAKRTVVLFCYCSTKRLSVKCWIIFKNSKQAPSRQDVQQRTIILFIYLFQSCTVYLTNYFNLCVPVSNVQAKTCYYQVYSKLYSLI